MTTTPTKAASPLSFADADLPASPSPSIQPGGLLQVSKAPSPPLTPLQMMLDRSSSPNFMSPAALRHSSSRVVERFEESLKVDPQLAATVAAMKVLTQIIKDCKANTIMGLREELQVEVDQLVSTHSSSISVAGGCELFMQFVTRTALDVDDFALCKAKLIERGECFIARLAASREKIAQLALPFIKDGSVILVHGYSRVVCQALRHAARNNVRFRVLLTEARPNTSSIRAARVLIAESIPVEIIMDCAAAAVMDTVDMVICGSESIVENGGIINKVGTFQLAIVAKAFNKPMYVMAESFKFVRLFPLNQSEIPRRETEFRPCHQCTGGDLPHGVTYYNPQCDYTPPVYLSLLFTELGILTPSAVSDELIKLYAF
eukprot:TRINITY_DN3709_c0_g1_i2.p1 TRINITY_DN3709_c0_g1~~TRINITY_DN3709_c0_g1_i2.p1  ORF type:complete len:391 (-),score=103.48 TRINITY_DN3709_c0_g1_i2:48-1172(-)